MKPSLSRLLKQLNARTIERDVDEELRFHMETLTCDYVRQGLSPAEAIARTAKRFGDVSKVRNQCVRIRRRSHPLQRFIKVFLILLALVGLGIRVVSTDPNVAHIGDTLIMIAVTGRLLLYARSFSSTTFLPKSKTSLFTNNPQA